jgi:predicted dehydrogenase
LINIGVIGLGHWGPNLVRNFSDHPEVTILGVCDIEFSAFDRVKRFLPSNCIKTIDPYVLINDQNIDAIVLVTPPSTHYSLVKAALNSKKHVFCEKPLTFSPIQDLELNDIANKRKLVLTVGFTFLYNNGILKIKKVIEEERLGEIYYFTATRTHLGLIRQDVNVLWDLAPHDISIMNFLLGSTPELVSAIGSKSLRTDRCDVSFINLVYPSGIIGQLKVSWIDSNKERYLSVVGSHARVTFDDLNSLEPVRFYEKGIGHQDRYDANFGEFKYLLRDGDITSPKIEIKEPLKNIVDSFVDTIIRNGPNRCDGLFSSKVSGVIDAAQKSIENHGKPETIFD